MLEEEIEEIMLELFKEFTEGMKDEEMESIPKSAKKVGGDSLAVALLLDETDAEETMLLKFFVKSNPLAVTLSGRQRVQLRTDQEVQ